MKLLIVKLSALGDVVHAMDAVKQVPHTEIHWVIEKPFAPLVEDIASKVYVAETKKWRKNPFKYLSEIRAFIQRLSQEKYDIVIDLQGNIKSSLVLPFVQAPRKVGFSKQAVPEKVNLLFTNERYTPTPGQNIREDYLELLEKAIGFKGSFTAEVPKKLVEKILVCPGSAWENKKLSTEQLVQFLKLYGDKEFSVLWGNESERVQAEALASRLAKAKVLPKLSLDQLKGVMLKHDLVVAMDSFPLHYAAYLGLATYSFFGPSSGSKYAPVGPSHTHIQGSCPYGKSFNKRCPVLRSCPTGACLKDLKF